MARKVIKEFTYYALIKEAIYNSLSKQATTSEIFAYVRAKHPTIFKNSNSMTWMGNIRQLLSKHPEFQKLEKKNGSKLHYWIHKPIEVIEEEENRLNKCLLDYPKDQNGNDTYSNYDQYGYYWIDYWDSSTMNNSNPLENWYKGNRTDKKY